MIVLLLGPHLSLSEGFSRTIIDLRYHGTLENIGIRRPRMLVRRRRSSWRIVDRENRNIDASLTSERLLRQNVNNAFRCRTGSCSSARDPKCSDCNKNKGKTNDRCAVPHRSKAPEHCSPIRFTSVRFVTSGKDIQKRDFSRSKLIGARAFQIDFALP